MTTDTQFLSTKEVAEILGVHQKTVHHWLRNGRLAGTKISYRAWRIPRAALDEFIARNSNVQPRDAIYGAPATGTQPLPENPGDSHSSRSPDAPPETKMKHYIRDIMGEDSNSQTKNG
jgi:excisionase family DNA binding protein